MNSCVNLNVEHLEEALRLLEELLEARQGVATWMTATRELRGTRLTDAIVHDVASLCDLLDADFARESRHS